MGTPAMWLNLSSDAQQLTMRIVFVLCSSFIPAKFYEQVEVLFTCFCSFLTTIYSFKTPFETELE